VPYLKKDITLTICIIFALILPSFALAEDVLNTYCGDGICDPLEEAEGHCCEDCGGCNELVVETGVMDVVEAGVTEVVENNIVVKTDNNENSGAVGTQERKKGIFGIIIDFFRKLFGKEKESEKQILPEPEIKCPDGICDDFEIREGLCPQDCKDVKGWGDTAKQPEQKPGTGEINKAEMTKENAQESGNAVCGNSICEPSEKAENTCCEDCKEGGCGGNDGAVLENCGDGICNDWDETSTNCPQDCGYDGVEIVDDEDEFKKNYNDIMAEMKGIIPEVPEKEKLLDISSFYTPSATCYFSAGTSLANYMEGISYDEFIWYGRPLYFQYDTRWDTLRTGVGGGELTFESFYNLGYKAYVGRTKKMYLPTPEKLHMQASRNFIFFDTDDEALEFIKRLLSADIPVMINLQIGTTGDFLFIKGYDETHIFIPPYVDSSGEYIFLDKASLFSEEAVEDKETQSLSYKEFFSLWEDTGNNFYWFVKNNEIKRKTEQEMFQANKKDAEEAYGNVQKFIENPDFRFHTSGEDMMTATAAASRYLTKQGYTELGRKYMELATLYDKQRNNQWQDLALYSQTAELYKKAAELW